MTCPRARHIRFSDTNSDTVIGSSHLTINQRPNNHNKEAPPSSKSFLRRGSRSLNKAMGEFARLAKRGLQRGSNTATTSTKAPFEWMATTQWYSHCPICSAELHKTSRRTHRRSASAPPAFHSPSKAHLRNTNTSSGSEQKQAVSDQSTLPQSIVPNNKYGNSPHPKDFHTLSETPIKRSWIQSAIPFSICVTQNPHLPNILQTGQLMELRRIYQGDILLYHSRLYYFLSHKHRTSANNHIMSMIGLHDGQEITARAPTVHTPFRVCTNISYAKMLVLQLDMSKGLSEGARYRIVLEGTGGRKEQMYVFSDGGESEFQFHRAHKMAVENEHAVEAPVGRKGLMVLYLMKLDQHPGAMYVMGWRRPGRCQLTKVDSMAWTPKYHAGRERDLKVGWYCVRKYLRGVDQVLVGPEDVLVKLRDGDKHSKCEACGYELD